jgi:hypothetical protein
MSEPQEKPKLPAEELKLDKFKGALATLREQIDSKHEFHLIENELKKAFEKDAKEELKISTEDSEALWLRAKQDLLETPKWNEVLQKKVEESAEKSDLDEFVEDVENYDVIKDAIEKASGDIGVLKKLLSSLEDKWNKSKFGKSIKWGALTAWFGKYFIEFANAGLKKLEEAKAQGSIFTGMWKSPIYNKIKDLGKWFSGVNKMEKQIKVAFKAGKYKQAKQLVKKIQKIEPKNEVAKKCSKDIKDIEEGKKTPKPPAAPSTAATTAAIAATPAAGIAIPEIKPKTDLDHLKDVFAAKHIPLANISKTEYANFLKNKRLKPDEFIKIARGALNKNNAVGMINHQVQKHPNLKDGKFKFELQDVYISQDNKEEIARALEGLESKYQNLDAPNLTPTKFRNFLNATQTGGESLEQYKA